MKLLGLSFKMTDKENVLCKLDRSDLKMSVSDNLRSPKCQYLTALAAVQLKSWYLGNPAITVNCTHSLAIGYIDNVKQKMKQQRKF